MKRVNGRERSDFISEASVGDHRLSRDPINHDIGYSCTSPLAI